MLHLVLQATVLSCARGIDPNDTNALMVRCGAAFGRDLRHEIMQSKLMSAARQLFKRVATGGHPMQSRPLVILCSIVGLDSVTCAKSNAAHGGVAVAVVQKEFFSVGSCSVRRIM